MAEIKATDLTPETAGTLDGSEQFVMFDSTEGKRGTVDVVGGYILQNGDADGNGNTISSIVSGIDTKAGNLSDLTTTDKSDLVSAINEVDANTNTNASAIGTLSNLTTSAKSDLVAAVNEVDAHADTAQSTADGNTANIGTLSNLTTTDKSTVVSAINEVDANCDSNTTALSTKAEIDGYYENLTAGNAEQLISTVTVEDKVPYNFRTAGGTADIGNRLYEQVVGGTIAWNQLFPFESDSWSVNGLDVVVSNGKMAISGEATASNSFALFPSRIYNQLKLITNHVYLLYFDGDFDFNSLLYAVYGNTTTSTNMSSKTPKMFKPTQATITDSEYVASTTAGVSYNAEFTTYLCDLTQMFGSIIADYVYSLGDTDGYAWFKSLFPKPYYAYNAGELMSVNTSEHDTVGFNQWDEETESGYIDPATGAEQSATTKIRMKNYMPVLPNTTYYKKTPTAFWCVYFDKNKNYLSYGSANANATFTTPSGAYYMRSGFESAYGTTYNQDICINLSWSGYRNGEYEAYKKNTYALDSSLELRGIPKLDADNKLYYDGDTYSSDGTVTRKYAILEGQTVSSGSTLTLTGCDTSATDIITSIGHLADVGTLSGTTLTLSTSLSSADIVYPLATETTETADSYTSPQVVDDFGTEEYIDYAEEQSTRDVAVPVGHNSEYPANLRDKLQHLPDLASSDGTYLITQANNEMSLTAYTGAGEISALQTKVPDPPSTDGTYKLQVVVSGGTYVYSWV